MTIEKFLSKGSKGHALIMNIIIILIAIFIGWSVYRKLFPVKEGVVGEVKKAIREIESVGRKVGEIPRKIEKVGNDIKNVGDKVGDGVKGVIDDTRDIGNQIENEVNKAVKKVEEEGNKVIKTIDKKFWEFLDEVERVTKDIVNNKILGFFNELGKALEKAFADPIVVLFNGIGRVFELLRDIIMMIIQKILNLPDCVPWYGLDAGSAMSKKFLPGWLRALIKFWQDVGNWMLWLFKPLLILVGIDVDGWRKEIKRKCFDFPAKKKTDEMKRVMDKAGNKFLNTFGRVEMKFNY